MMLREFYQIGLQMKRAGDWPVEMYEDRKIRWEVWLTEDGVLRPDGVKVFDQKSEPFAAPDRPNNKVPCLIVDNPEYTLGVGENGEKNHAMYMALLQKCAAETGDRTVATVHDFLRDHLGDLIAEMRRKGFADSSTRGDGSEAAEWINFRVGSDCPVDRSNIRAWWASYARDEVDSDELCCISGVRGRITRKFPVWIRVNGKRCKLASVDSPACKSYGFDKSDHAPMSHDAALIAGTALKLIIADRESSKRFGDVNFAFWTKDKSIRTGLAALVSMRGEDQARVSQVKALFESIFRGQEYYPAADKFYLLVVTNAETRIVIRASVEGSLGHVVGCVQDWFRGVELTGPGRDLLTVHSLHDAIQVSNKRQNRSASLALVQNALFGTPLERPIYAAVFPRIVSHVHKSKGAPEWRCPTKEQVSIIKLYLSQKNPEVKDLVALKEDFPDIAYHYGRLLAAYEAIQLDASPNVQSTVTERFISAMMVNPRRTVAKLDVLSRAHLRKAARDKGKGYAVNHSKRLQSINDCISALGAAEQGTLSLDQRGLFVLGYWHEKFKTYNPDKKEDTHDAAGSEDTTEDSRGQ